MHSEWECRKCKTKQDPHGDYSAWRCTNCGALRWPWLLPAGIGCGLVLIIAVFWGLIKKPTVTDVPKESNSSGQVISSEEKKFLDQVKISLDKEPKLSSETIEKLRNYGKRQGLQRQR